MGGARLRVCMTTQEYPPVFSGGLALAVQRVAGFMTEMGWEVHVAHLNVEEGLPGLLDEIAESTVEGGVAVHRFSIGRERDLPGDSLWDSPNNLAIRLMYHCLDGLHRRHGFHVFHSFFIYPTGYVAGLLARVHRRRFILSIRGNDINQFIFGAEKAVFLEAALRQADMVTAVAHDLLVKAEALTPVMHKSRVIFNSIPPGYGGVSSIALPGLEGPVIGTAGLFKHSKGFPYLLKAFRRIRRERTCSLLLVGDFREAEREIESRYLSRFGSEGVHVTGFVPHGSVGSYLKEMDVFVIPSLSEGCPNVLLEAMAAARPIVATRTGAIPEIIRHRESGLLVDPGDAAQIEEAVRYLLDHRAEAKEMGRAARRRIGDFSEAREKKGWEEVYRLISNGLSGNSS
ncbi:MAG: glycosyltransferase [Deltaproteobacteria bacterium]|nr:glycosyltransferase [Deltaproteobacteria bacterium]MBW2121546.1 glycosyltransferase [Deltaproteobacteria bacterium]